MDLLTWGRSPWGEWILTHISWDLLWASLFAGLAFLVAHASYMVLSTHRKRDALETDRLEAARSDLPARIPRHSLAARLFHWVMAAAMFVLLFTAFLPIAGVQFAWVTWHWMAGLVLTASIVFHIVHATVWMDFWSIWVGPKDVPELKAELLRELGQDVDGPKSGKYPLGNRLYHLAIVVAGLACRRQRPADDGPHPDAAVHAQPIPARRLDVGRHVRRARAGRSGAGRAGHRTRVLRCAAREMVDHQVDDPRLDHQAPVSRAPRSAALDRPVMDLAARCDAIEECYEFMLAYAAQGVVDEAGSPRRVSFGRFFSAPSWRSTAWQGPAAPPSMSGGLRAGRSLCGVHRRARPRRAERAGSRSPRPRAALDRLTAHRQPERVDPRARAAHRPVPDRRDPEDPRAATRFSGPEPRLGCDS